jgi:Relaxase/Mobilisation nuclease domain
MQGDQGSHRKAKRGQAGRATGGTKTVIINGASRSAGAWFARHLMNAETNERVTLIEISGFRRGVTDIASAFDEMEVMADTRRRRLAKYFYQANINPESDEKLTPRQWEQATDALERKLGLTGQPRFVIEHEKEGRIHRHVVWFRIDMETGAAISDSLNYQKHEQTARELEAAFGLKIGESSLVPGSQHRHDKDTPKSWERFRGMQSGIDPRDLAAQLTGLWQAADSGKAFAAAIEAQGFMLAKGDKAGVFLVIDPTGQEHSLVRRLKGVTTADMRARMSDIDRDALPDAVTARAAQRVKAASCRAGRPQEARKAAGAGIATPGAPAALPEAVRGFSEQREQPHPMAAAPVPFRYTGRHTAQAPGFRFPAGPPPEGQKAERGALLAPQPQSIRKPVLETQRAAPDQIGRGSPMQYRGRAQAHTAGFRFPAWMMPAPARAAKDPNSPPPPPPAPGRKEGGDGIPFVNKPYRGNVNTLAPTPEDIPEEPEARANYFRALHGIPHPGDLKNEREREKARKQQEQQEQAARRKAEKGSGRAGKAARPPRKRGRPPPRSRFTRWLDKFRDFVRKIGGKPTGSQIDSNLVLDEALRTQMAKNQKEQDKKMAAPQAKKMAARAQPDQRAKLIAAQQKKPGRHSYSTLPKFTAGNIDSSATTQPQSAPASGEPIMQAKAVERQAGQQIHARNTEIARAQNEGDLQKWRLNWFKFKFR